MISTSPLALTLERKPSIINDGEDVSLPICMPKAWWRSLYLLLVDAGLTDYVPAFVDKEGTHPHHVYAWLNEFLEWQFDFDYDELTAKEGSSK
jgi:hypothetical protein